MSQREGLDEKTSQLAILKDGKVKAKATVHFGQRGEKARDIAFRTIAKGGVAELIGVTFGGSNQNLILSGSSGAVTVN